MSDFWLASDALTGSPDGRPIGEHGHALEALADVASNSADLGGRYSTVRAMSLDDDELPGGASQRAFQAGLGDWSGWGRIADAFESGFNWYMKISKDWRWVYLNAALTLGSLGRIPFFFAHRSDGGGGVVKEEVCCPKSLTVDLTPKEERGGACAHKMHIKVTAEFRQGMHKGKNCACRCCEVRQFLSYAYSTKILYLGGRVGTLDVGMDELESNPDFLDAWRKVDSDKKSVLHRSDSDAYLTVYDTGAAAKLAKRPDGAPATFKQTGRFWGLDQGMLIDGRLRNFYNPKDSYPKYIRAGRGTVRQLARTFGDPKKPIPGQTVSKCKVVYEDDADAVRCLSPFEGKGRAVVESWAQTQFVWLIRPKGCKGDELEASTIVEGYCKWTAATGTCVSKSTPAKPITIKGK